MDKYKHIITRPTPLCAKPWVLMWIGCFVGCSCVDPGQDIQMQHFTPLFGEDARQRGSEQAQAIVLLFYTVAVKR